MSADARVEVIQSGSRRIPHAGVEFTLSGTATVMFAWSLLRDGFPFLVVLSSGHREARRHCLHAIERARGRNHHDGSRQYGELNAAALVSMRRVLNDVTANAPLAGFVAEEDLSLRSLLLK
jgi:hypothetical protein